MNQVKELLNNDPFALSGMNFTEFKAHCKSLGIKVKDSAELIELFTHTEYPGIYHYKSSPESDVLIELSNPAIWDTKTKKSKQYYFQVIGNI